ncbi:hypothetical protein Tamer19_72550 [Cupriavidus sp. TA19]|uniref:hypothetical protein n=1 Tax=Cupriavidus sp. TA19 TaxID=701108 RepID=UPI002729444E|nr:hypothetical protein [Cupriavidus sp. TA19]GLC97846.1 hypothetical protein Tamer19_72550 [Cupriavidus sp. TA19]
MIEPWIWVQRGADTVGAQLMRLETRSGPGYLYRIEIRRPGMAPEFHSLLPGQVPYATREEALAAASREVDRQYSGPLQ